MRHGSKLSNIRVLFHVFIFSHIDQTQSKKSNKVEYFEKWLFQHNQPQKSSRINSSQQGFVMYRRSLIRLYPGNYSPSLSWKLHSPSLSWKLVRLYPGN